jgi:hypothetical protein
MKQIDFKSTWTCADAIRNLFFEEDDTVSKSELKNWESALKNCIRQCFDNDEQRGITKDEQLIVSKAVEAIRKTMPERKFFDSLHSILWIRWASHLPGPPLASTKLLQLHSWRASFKPWRVPLLQYWNPDTDNWKGKKQIFKKIARRPGYTIDDVLTREKFPFKEYEQTWEIEFMQYGAGAEENRLSKPIEEVCGKKQLQTLKNCVYAEARRGTRELIATRRTQGRYKSLVSCSQLVGQLIQRYPELDPWKPSSLIRGISKFVSF